MGAAAIIGVPPFNGFVSEWLVYQGMFLGVRPLHPGTGRLLLLGIPALALIGALALACFAKVAGVVFLGAPRSTHASAADDGNAGLFGPMLALAGACVALGVLPAIGIGMVRDAAADLARVPGTPIPAFLISGAWKISAFASGIVLACAIVWRVRSWRLRAHGVRRGETWSCGYASVTPRMQYTGSSFAAPLLAVFGALTGVRTARTPTSFHTHPVDLVLEDGVMPMWRALQRAALRLRPIQQGRLHVYLLYVLAALVIMLAYLALGAQL
jgi:hydrogenase-4 component B